MQPANVKCISENAGSKGLRSLNKHSKVLFMHNSQVILKDQFLQKKKKNQTKKPKLKSSLGF